MKAWRLAAPGGELRLTEVERPAVRAGTVLVRVQATPLLSYLGDYLAGKLPYLYPHGAFTPGTYAVGVIEAIGDGVHHLQPGSRAFLSPYVMAAEPVPEPAAVLAGLTAIGEESRPLLADWSDGTLAEWALAPASSTFPLTGLDHLPAEQLAALAKFSVPFGGLLRGRLAAGGTLIVNGATGYFGSAATELGLAVGASLVVAAGRDRRALADLRSDARLRTVALEGNLERDSTALREACAGGADVALDMVGRATSSDATVASLRALRRGGRLVLMGSMSVPLPIDYRDLLQHDREVIGNFMYPPSAVTTLLNLVRSGLLDLAPIRLRRFSLNELAAAVAAAREMRSLDCVVVTVP